MQRRQGTAMLVALFVLSVGLPAAAIAATGSWVAAVPATTVAMSDRSTATRRVAPPAAAHADGRAIERVQWRFATPPGKSVDAWLCHPRGCVALAGRRGATRAFAGYRAGAPLYFRFRLPPGQPPFQIEGMQLIVSFR
ncbi:hypothetical protein GCM10022228_14230 [Halomonas cibimaris]|uniref:Flagellar FlhE n=1 Tax=Halomonas cibimaris TaxID=657012 RepID=A0ABP7LPP4_9GAMM